jgi:hypothetical protein
MWRHPIVAVLLGAYISWGAYNWFVGRPVRAPDGVLAPAEPRQIDLQDGPTARIKNWTLKSRAEYRITARILGVERYRFDRLSSLVPEDLALGWGPMSDNSILRGIEISQSDRWYFWHRLGAGGPSREAISTHSANTHVIPADVLVARQLSRLRPGQLVTLEGDLVDSVRDDGFRFNTSMSRTDTGAGACEVMLVRDVEVAAYR